MKKKKSNTGCRIVLFIILGIVLLCILSWVITIDSDWDTFREFGKEVYQFAYLGNREALQRKKKESVAIESLENNLLSEFPSGSIDINIWPKVPEDRNEEYVFAISIELINPEFLVDLNPSDVLDTAEIIAEAVYGQYPYIEEYESISIKVTKKTDLVISRTEFSSTYWFLVNDFGDD